MPENVNKETTKNGAEKQLKVTIELDGELVQSVLCREALIVTENCAGTGGDYAGVSAYKDDLRLPMSSAIDLVYHLIAIMARQAESSNVPETLHRLNVCLDVLRANKVNAFRKTIADRKPKVAWEN